jgi:hypothetical protein
MQGQPKSNAGTIAAVIGGLAAVGGIVAAGVAASGKKPAPRLGGVRRPLGLKKPCGCGR